MAKHLLILNCSYSTDKLLIRCIRGGLALVCLLVVSLLVYVEVIWEPIALAGQSSTKILRVVVPPGGFPAVLRTAAVQQQQHDQMLMMGVLVVPVSAT